MTLYQNDPTATIFLLAEKLKERGYTAEEAMYGGVTFHSFTKNDRTWITTGFKISYPFNTKAVSDISSDKAVAYDFAQGHGVSVPGTVTLKPGDTLAEATELLERYGKVIVKPINASLAHGVTLNIVSVAEIEQAVQVARDYSDTVLVQQQVRGDELRIAVVKGKAVAALLRQTARVVGDGKTSIAQLIRDENDARAKLDTTYFIYPPLDGQLIDPKLLTDERVLPEGEVLELSHSAMVRYGASMYNVLKDVDSGYIEAAERVGSALSRDFIIVDMMIEDYTAVCTPDNYWFIEFNTSPILKLFHGPRDGNAVDIVGLVAERIDRAVQHD